MCGAKQKYKTRSHISNPSLGFSRKNCTLCWGYRFLWSWLWIFRQIYHDLPGILHLFALTPLKIHVISSIFGVYLSRNFQRLLIYPLEFSIDMLNRGLQFFFSGKAYSMIDISHDHHYNKYIIIILLTLTHLLSPSANSDGSITRHQE